MGKRDEEQNRGGQGGLKGDKGMKRREGKQECIRESAEGQNAACLPTFGIPSQVSLY